MVHEGLFDSRILFPGSVYRSRFINGSSASATRLLCRRSSIPFSPPLIVIIIIAQCLLLPFFLLSCLTPFGPPPFLPIYFPFLLPPPPLKPFGPLLRKTVSSIPVSCSPPSSSPARIPRLPFVAGRPPPPPPCLGSVVLRWGGGGRRQVSDRGERQGPSTTATLLPGGDGGEDPPPFFPLLFLVVAKQP